MSTTCPQPRSKVCAPGSVKVSSPYCIEGADCTTLRIQEAVTVDASCIPTATEFQIVDDTGNVTGIYTGAIKKVPCDPMRVKIVDACATTPTAPPVSVPATSCGADTTVQATNALSQAVHTAPGTALLVKLCPQSNDREFVVLCDRDGVKVAIQNVTPENSPLGTPPVFEAWLLDGFPYFGDVADLTDCGAEKVDIAQSLTVCKNGQEFTRTDFWDVQSTPRALLGSVWQNVLGAVVAAPALPFTVGKCEVVVQETITGWAASIDGQPSNSVIAGATRSATANFAGAPSGWDSSAVPSNLHSITISARSVTDGVNTANQIIVEAPGGEAIALFNNQTITFNIGRDPETGLRRDYRVRAFGNAYANIFGTYQ